MPNIMKTNKAKQIKQPRIPDNFEHHTEMPKTPKLISIANAILLICESSGLPAINVHVKHQTIKTKL